MIINSHSKKLCRDDPSINTNAKLIFFVLFSSATFFCINHLVTYLNKLIFKQNKSNNFNVCSGKIIYSFRSIRFRLKFTVGILGHY